MKKNTFWVSFCTVILALLFQVSNGQLSQTETRILFQIQKLLEYPESLQKWSNWTNLCYLPPSPSLKITCSNNHITELTIIGNKTSSNSQQILSKSFSIDSFFTVLTKLSNLRLLSLVSLGIWGPLPAKVNRFSSLEVLNISSNFINGGVPTTITKLQNLKSLVLAHNLLNGSVPDLNSLSALEELDLSGNRFGPEFPSLGISLVSVLLRNNSFRSEIPSKVQNFNKLQQLDVAYNKFMGPIPSSLFSLPSIQYLSLAYNQFSGELSVNISCSSKLQFVDISHNLLIGKLPTCIGSKSSNRTVVSSWNCLSSGDLRYQNKYSFCHKEAMAVKPPPKEKESKTKLGLMLGIIGGIVGFAVVAILVALVIIRRGRRRNRSEITKLGRSVADKTSLHSSPLSEIESRPVPQTMRLASLGLPQYRVFTLEEIEEATNNFDPLNLMGEGPQGQIYKGWLSYGSVVLVKCQKLKQKHLPQNLTQQMEVLQNLRHRHLVSVLGHCIVTYQDHPNTSSTVFIVTEHVSNGSLRDNLTDWRKKEMLKWPQRMAITIGAARGVLFLHTGIAPRIYGNNLKIENILLDNTLSAKISNYNIPLPFNATDAPSSRNGTAEKEDIYQLGVILLEVLTGKIITSTSELDELKRQLEKGLTEAASKLRGVVDPSIQGSFAYDSLKTTTQITINCLNKDSSKRPSIEDVLWNLQYSMQVQEGWTSSGNLGMTM